MAYIGKTPTVGNFQVCDAISVVNNQAAYTMQVGGVNVSPETANHMLVSLNGILQAPGSSYTVSGSTITFASNLVTGDVINFIQILGSVLDLGVPSDATVSTAKIVDGAVTSAKLASGTGGKVLQCVYSVNATNVTFSNTTYGDVITINITPSKSTSDILIQANLMYRGNSTTGQDQGTAFKILRDSTELFASGGYQSYIYSNGANIDNKTNFSTAYLDTAHNTTSQITYKIQGNSQTGGGSIVYNETGESTLWVMEIDQ